MAFDLEKPMPPVDDVSLMPQWRALAAQIGCTAVTLVCICCRKNRLLQQFAVSPARGARRCGCDTSEHRVLCPCPRSRQLHAQPMRPTLQQPLLKRSSVGGPRWTSGQVIHLSPISYMQIHGAKYPGNHGWQPCAMIQISPIYAAACFSSCCNDRYQSSPHKLALIIL